MFTKYFPIFISSKQVTSKDQEMGEMEFKALGPFYADERIRVGESKTLYKFIHILSFTDGDVSVCINECLTCSLIQVKYFFGSDMILRNANVRSFVCSMKVCLEHTIFIF